MPISFSPTRRLRPALAVAALAYAGALIATGSAGAAPAGSAAPAQTAPAQTAPAQAAPQGGASKRLTSADLLQLEDLRAAGVRVDSAELGSRGDQDLGDAGRFDEGCLWEKTMRNITSAKAYPAPGTARAYFDGVWTSTRDKEVWAKESITEGRTTRAANRYVRILLDEIASVQDCQEVPAQGNYYGRPHRIRVGSATATYFLDYTRDGRAGGGGVAVIRDGKRVGFVSLMAAPGHPGVALKKLSRRAAADLR